ncbi:hypothetical protein BD626DRAFT_412771 [Schizophyllum amplum]|uniref:NAD(P)-binding protein n=1 Tax=Schizophyllum amplum TaxID=97359 RepID=A0A550BWN4_9AGAR|nr:hypothetical protein BD626DRAFT_412771 [Auriculariopsis ampla]
MSNDAPTAPSLSSSDLFDVNGLVVVITGGGTGIGLMMAKALENNGATVYIIGRRLKVLEEAAAKNNRYNKIIPLEGDITDRESLQRLATLVEERSGQVDLLINNAAIARNFFHHPLPSPDPTAPQASLAAFQSALWDTGTPDDFAASFATNTTAVYYTTVAFLHLLYAAGNHTGLACNGSTPAENGAGPTANPTPLSGPRPRPAQVISVASSGAFRIDAGVLSPSYTLSKAACAHLGRVLANLLAPWGIRSNVLAPGVWPTDMTTNPEPGVQLSPDVLAQAVPLRRVGTEEDMAGTILFLASRAAAYVNGAVWLVDGGRVGSLPSNYCP